MAMSSESSDEAYHENEKQMKERNGKRKIYNLMSRHGIGRDKFQERLDFKFYDFQALQIEKGWNKLFVSIISMETGETIAKSSKASVQNGQCHWEDSMLSTIWISDDSLEDNESCLLKLLVAMESTRFGTLGEATINLANYIRPETSTASLPLKQHCSHGAILQVKIQCLTPRRKYRKDANSYSEEMSVGYDDIDSISDISDNAFSRTSESSLCDQLENTYYRGALSSKRRSPLATYSDHDDDSLESSFSSWTEKCPQQSNVSGLKNNMYERHDSTYSDNGPYPQHGASRSISSSSTLGTQLQDKLEDFGNVSHASDTTSTRSVDSSKDMLGAAQVTIELLHGEVKMWQENARKLTIDVERLRKHLNKKSKNKKDLEMELSASRKENDELKEEIQRLTIMEKQNDSKNHKFQIEEMDNIIKELKDEIKYQKGLNYDLELKPKKAQESNTGMEFCHSDVHLCTNGNAIRCLHEGIELQEFWNLELERQLMQEKQKNMESTIQFLEKTLDEKDQEMQTARRFMAQTLEENEVKWRHRLFEKEKQIINFEKKLSDGVNAFSNEMIALTQTLQHLEAEFDEKQGKSRKDLIISGSFSSNFPLFDSDTAINITEVFQELCKQLQLSAENLKDQDSLLGQMTFTKNEICFNISELSKDVGKIDLKELTEAILCTIILLKKLLKTKATSSEYEINSHQELVRKRIRDNNEFQNEGESAEANKLKSDKVLGKEKACPRCSKVEYETQAAYLQSKIAYNFSTDFPNNVRNLSELESSDDEQNVLVGSEAENVQLSERIFVLEAELRHLNEEKELTHLAMENSENVVINLQAEIKRMEAKNEAEKIDLKIKEESMKKKWIEVQEECSFLKVANLKSQATNEKLIKESKTLQTTNGELRMQNLELHSRCTVLESKLGKSQIAFVDIQKKAEDLEYKFTSMLEEIDLKEKTINVDLDALLQESKKQHGRFLIAEIFLTQMYLEKTAEVSSLQREIEQLRDQISGICDRHKRIAANIVLEVYDLCADKAMLEAALQEEQEKVKLYETKLDNLRAEYEVQVQNYTEELAAARENQETLMVNHEKVVVLLEKIKSNEEKLENIVRVLEAELKVSELERLQAREEISELEVQLQKTEMLQDELFILKRSLYEAESEYRRLEASYQILSLEHDELKAKEISYKQRISTTEKVTSELEDCKLSKVELEEKVFRLEWDLTTKEASWRNNAQLKYELAQMTRENGQLHKKKDSLQQENEEYQKKVKALEEKLKQKDEKDNCSSIKSGERPLLPPHPSNVTHNKLLTEQC
ncbi:NT-type C2 domain [Sesbania bispinosa]|nr:NT-type C2 domain [Sesbania bispinosa]